MNRRHFLQLFGATAAAIVLDPERALWVPGAKTIFVPPARPITPVTGIAISPSMFQRGDVFTIDGKFAHHPQTGAEMPGVLQQFVVTHDADCSSGVIQLQMIWPRLTAADVPRRTKGARLVPELFTPRDRGWSHTRV